MPKRKASGDPAPVREPKKPRRRATFTAAKTASTKRIIKRNFEESPLLRLPLEILRKIIFYAVGNQQVHAKYLQDFVIHQSYHWSALIGAPTFQWSTLICPKNPNPSSLEGRMTAARDPHKSEHMNSDSWLTSKEILRDPVVSPKAPVKIIPRFSGPFGLLATCRYIYQEAHAIFWSTSTFSFNDHKTWAEWISQRSSKDKSYITSIRIVMTTQHMPRSHGYGFSKREWDFAFRLPILRTLPALRHLNLQFDIAWWAEYDKLDRNGQLGPFLDGRDAPSVLKFKHLTLQDVQVWVGSVYGHNRNWSEGQAKLYAGMIKERLLESEDERKKRIIRVSKAEAAGSGTVAAAAAAADGAM